MSPVSRDTSWIHHHGATYGDNPSDNKTDHIQERETASNVPQKDKTAVIKSRKNSDQNQTGQIQEGGTALSILEKDERIHKRIKENPEKNETDPTNKIKPDSKADKDKILKNKTKQRILDVNYYRETNDGTTDKGKTGNTHKAKTANSKSAADKLKQILNHTSTDETRDGEKKQQNVSFISGKRKTNKYIFKKKDPVGYWRKLYTKRTLKKRYRNQHSLGSRNVNDIAAVERFPGKNKPCHGGNEDGFSKKSPHNAIVKITKDKCKRQKWTFNSGVLISLVMLNVTGLSGAVESSGFTSTLTSRMIASFLGYPATCSLGAEVRPCTLTLTCWLRGGTRLRGCGGWLFSCCGPPEANRESFDNSIPSSDWKYKMSPPKLRQVPHRNVMPNNVFRRRVDDDVSQMDCGVPSSRILQKRIIGGREARFAEFPWQAHVRISEFQCGGVLVSRWFVATAAHCVSRAHTRDIAVWLGAIDTSATHHPARKIGVVQKVLHPLFQFRMTQPDRFDIALLKLSRPVTYMSHILPICLPDYDMDLRGRSGVIAGWGKTDASNSHTGTNLLRSATVPILSKEQCINWHQSKQISVEIHSEMICAGHSDGHQDACLGDSGGPLIVLDNGRYFLVGITSAGFGCGVDHQPGIYHNVKVTAKWIRGIIAPSVNYIDV